jgi:hypothetical protein
VKDNKIVKNNITKKVLASVAVLMLFAAVAIAVPVRVYQLIHDIDFSSGFFISTGGSYNNLLLSVIVVAIVLFIVISILLSKRTVSVPLRNKPMNFIWCGVLCIASIATLVVMVIAPRRGAYTVSEWILFSLLAVNIFALAYCAYASYKKHSAAVTDILYLLPTAYTAMFLITKFITFTSILTISEHSLDVLALSSLILFLLFRFSYARDEKAKTKTKVLSEIFAFMGGVIGAAAYIPRVIVFFIGNANAKAYIVFPTIWELAVMLFAVCCVVSAMSSNILRSKNDDRAA